MVGEGLVDGVQVRGHSDRHGLFTTLAVLDAALGHDLDHAVDVLHLDSLLALLLRGQGLLGGLAHLLAHLLLLHNLRLLLLNLGTTLAMMDQGAQSCLGQDVGQAGSAGSCKAAAACMFQLVDGCVEQAGATGSRKWKVSFIHSRVRGASLREALPGWHWLNQSHGRLGCPAPGMTLHLTYSV